MTVSKPTMTAFGGIRNTLPPERLKQGGRQPDGSDQRADLTAATNIDLDDSGRASRRAGQTLVAAGAAHSLYADGNLCLYVQNGQLKRLYRDYTSVVLASGLSDAPLRYVAVNGAVYWSDGTATGMINQDGLAQSWGMAVPAAPQAVRIAGRLPAGTYQYVQTWLGEDGQESGAGLPVRVDLPDASGLLFSWPAPLDPRISRAVFYLSTPNGEQLYQATSVPAGAGQAAFTGGALALPLNTAWLDAPPAGTDLAYHRGRIWIASGAYLFATHALGYGYCDLRDYLAIDGSLIQFVAGIEHGLFVGTERAVYFLQGDALADMTLTTVVDGYGVAGSAVLVDGFTATGDPGLAGAGCVLFASAVGICLGKPDGGVVNLTFDRYRTDLDPVGAAVLRTTTTISAQYLLATRR